MCIVRGDDRYIDKKKLLNPNESGEGKSSSHLNKRLPNSSDNGGKKLKVYLLILLAPKAPLRLSNL